MAVESGTATNYRDLLDKLRLFLTTNAALVAASQQWTELRWVTTGTTQELIVKGPGLGGTDNIYIGISSLENTVSDYFNWAMTGFTDYIPANTFVAQPSPYSNVLSSLPSLNLWNSTIPYTFIANGRRCMISVRVNTRYFQAYLGLLMPYATPAQVPYPMCVMGTSGAASSRWSSVTGSRTAHYMINATQWSAAAISNSTQLLPTDDNVYCLFPTLIHSPSYDLVNNRYLETYYGELDGLFFVPGLNNVSDNIITYSGADHLVVQDGPNTGLTSYMAMRLT